MRDLLLQMTSYPAPTPRWAIDAASWFAERHEARLSAAMCQTRIPQVSNWLANKLVHAGEAIAAENAKSRKVATELLVKFAEVVPAERRGKDVLVNCAWPSMADELAQWARTRDLTLVPVDDGLEVLTIAEGLVFGSGKPILLLPRSGGAGHRLDDVVVGWDGSRSAARALTDALPLLAKAKRVRLVQVAGDKDIGVWGRGEEAQRYLATHGITADVEEIERSKGDAGEALQFHASGAGADLLVIGAFGHSRAREFVLGGATRSVLERPLLPTLLSH